MVGWPVARSLDSRTVSRWPYCGRSTPLHNDQINTDATFDESELGSLDIQPIFNREYSPLRNSNFWQDLPNEEKRFIFFVVLCSQKDISKKDRFKGKRVLCYICIYTRWLVDYPLREKKKDCISVTTVSNNRPISSGRKWMFPFVKTRSTGSGDN